MQASFDESHMEAYLLYSGYLVLTPLTSRTKSRPSQKLPSISVVGVLVLHASNAVPFGDKGSDIAFMQSVTVTYSLAMPNH